MRGSPIDVKDLRPARASLLERWVNLVPTWKGFILPARPSAQVVLWLLQFRRNISKTSISLGDEGNNFAQMDLSRRKRPITELFNDATQSLRFLQSKREKINVLHVIRDPVRNLER